MTKLKKALPILYGVFLALFTAYVLLDAFVIPRNFVVVPGITHSPDKNGPHISPSPGGDVIITDDSYKDDHISIQLTQYREYNTDIYVADIVLSSAQYLKTAFANNVYGKNVTQTTSSIAKSHNAILAINGDYYGARSSGYVIRNGVLYRKKSAGDDQNDLVIYNDGSFDLIEEGSISAEQLIKKGANQVLSFGPGLIDNGKIVVDVETEVEEAMSSNPRTAIGIIDDLHYVMVVADGRTKLNTGLSLFKLAQFMQNLGVQTLYNLDGGGSSTMVFNGVLINNPTTNGSKIEERKVSDIVYVG